MNKFLKIATIATLVAAVSACKLELTDEAIEIINGAATERKRGDWLSNVVVEYDRLVSGMPAQADDTAGVLERIDTRLSNLEKQVALLINNTVR